MTPAKEGDLALPSEEELDLDSDTPDEEFNEEEWQT